VELLLRIDSRRGSRAPPNYEVRFDDDFFRVRLFYLRVDALQNGLRSKDTHLAERLHTGRNQNKPHDGIETRVRTRVSSP
jgi:hypothetical protein